MSAIDFLSSDVSKAATPKRTMSRKTGVNFHLHILSYMTRCKEAKFLCFTGVMNFFFKNLLFLLFLGHLGSERPQEKK